MRRLSVTASSLLPPAEKSDGLETQQPADRRTLLKHKSLLTNGCLPPVTKWCVDEETEREAGLTLAACRQFNPELRSGSLMNEIGSSRHTRTHIFLGLQFSLVLDVYVQFSQ
ncbi:hypothetical protein Q7C36_002748 [Tachysurus vachellii]|uniref:Uncharacterized protein n=1 Tax=Tachysurus vachellii TaxID=175792 RepID=A0AA88NTG2_TACVA|nr:hypothetical protein Q7C36_002748 [Tachysurus vachellii]